MWVRPSACPLRRRLRLNSRCSLLGHVCTPSALEIQYRKAVRADADAALILRQLDTYFSLYDDIGRGEKIYACPLCRYGRLCELCYLTTVGA